MKFSEQLLSVVLLLLVGLFTSCDTTSTNEEPGNGKVKIQFKTVHTSSSNKAVSTTPVFSAHDSLLIEGTNGTLEISDIRFIVEKFKLEPEDIDEEEDSLDSEIEEFESEPFFIDLPLGEDTLNLGDTGITAGLYEELEFEVKDLDFDEEDEEDAEHQALADSIRNEFPDWPDEASMVLTGSFTPTDGQAQAFKVFAKAEIEVEREFNPPLEVTEENVEQVVSIRINPVRWFKMEDGTVIDLSQYDWDENQSLIEFEAKFKDGIEELEVEEDDFDDD